jgi:hypothetical protein
MTVRFMYLIVTDLLDQTSAEGSLCEVEFDDCGVVGSLELFEVGYGMGIMVPFLVFDEDVFARHPSLLFITQNNVVYPFKSKLKCFSNDKDIISQDCCIGVA